MAWSAEEKAIQGVIYCHIAGQVVVSWRIEEKAVLLVGARIVTGQGIVSGIR